MAKKQRREVKRKTGFEFSKEFWPQKSLEIEENVLKLIKNTNNSSKKH